jgi:hypothetical protein
VTARSEWTRTERVLTLLEAPLALLIFAGAGGAVAGWRGGVFLAVGAALAGLGAHVARGIASYRRVMSRPWPRVQPLADDDS